MIKNSTSRQRNMSALKSVCLSSQAAESAAPHGPVMATPTAEPATALPVAAPALTEAAAVVERPALCAAREMCFAAAA